MSIGEFLTPMHLLVIFVVFCLTGPVVIVRCWQIFKKAGFPPGISLLVVVPLVNLLVLYYVAFSDRRVGAGSVTPVYVAGLLV